METAAPGPPLLIPGALHHSVIMGQPPPLGLMGNSCSSAATSALEIPACFLRVTPIPRSPTRLLREHDSFSPLRLGLSTTPKGDHTQICSG